MRAPQSFSWTEETSFSQHPFNDWSTDPHTVPAPQRQSLVALPLPPPHPERAATFAVDSLASEHLAAPGCSAWNQGAAQPPATPHAPRAAVRPTPSRRPPTPLPRRSTAKRTPSTSLVTNYIQLATPAHGRPHFDGAAAAVATLGSGSNEQRFHRPSVNYAFDLSPSHDLRGENVVHLGDDAYTESEI